MEMLSFTSGDMTDTTVSDTEPTETYEESVEDASDRDAAALLKQLPLPMIQNDHICVRNHEPERIQRSGLA